MQTALGGPVSPLGAVGWEWTTTENLDTASCFLWGIAAVSSRVWGLRDATGGQVESVQCW